MKLAVDAEIQRLIQADEPMDGIEQRALENVYAARQAAIAKRIAEAGAHLTPPDSA